MSNEVTKPISNVCSSKQITYRKGAGELFHRSFSVNITNLCPNSCVFCIRNMSDGWNKGDDLFSGGEPTSDEISVAVAQALDETTEFGPIIKVRVCGYGEPLLFPDRVKAVARQVKSYDDRIEVELITSGWPIYYAYEEISGRHEIQLKSNFSVADAIDELVDAGIDWVSVSLNATDEAEYVRIVRPVKTSESNAHEQTWLFMEALRSKGIRVVATWVEMPSMKAERKLSLRERLDAHGIEAQERPLVRMHGGGRTAASLSLDGTVKRSG